MIRCSDVDSITYTLLEKISGTIFQTAAVSVRLGTMKFIVPARLKHGKFSRKLG